MLSPLCRASTSNAAKAELLKSSKTQLTPVTIFSVYCHLASASGAWWQKLRDWGGASSLKPSGSLTQTQFHKKDSFINCNIHYSPSSVLLLCVYTRYNPFAHPSCTSLFILLFIKSQYTVFAYLICFALFYSIANCTLYFSCFFFLLIFIYMLLCCVTFI